MKQNKNYLIKLIDLIGSDTAFGNDEGREVYQNLSKEIDKFPEVQIFCISLKGLKRTDASFPRESVISIIKSMKGEKGFYLQDFETKDLMDNWDYAAKAKEQSVLVKKDKDFDILGPTLPAGSIELLKFIFKKGQVTTSIVADQFKISAPNASGKLKKLLGLGLVLANKETASSGGHEYIFKALNVSA